MIENGAVLPMFYLPPIEYFTKLNNFKPNILLEVEEHFPKQTYRNRANIYSP
ncbi:MAG: WbqC-like protein family protein, partial [Mucilaginibacter sp.]|nr:WbqC-like protein family protein [Mucilaginibacter sp.]